MPGATSTVYAERLQDPAWAEDNGQALARGVDEGTTYLTEATKPLAEHGVPVQVEAFIGNDAGEAITRYAQEHEVDLIAMATHGRTGLREVLHGSVAAAVLRSGVAPVLLVPSKK
jgi:nucleotide-binding universal stress UspA family protein